MLSLILLATVKFNVRSMPFITSLKLCRLTLSSERSSTVRSSGCCVKSPKTSNLNGNSTRSLAFPAAGLYEIILSLGATDPAFFPRGHNYLSFKYKLLPRTSNNRHSLNFVQKINIGVF